jgi:glycosyltransferase involved in cell wall biosynthesis
MLRKKPLVSVIVPAYNAEVFIERTIKSIINQTYTNIEVLVVDDGSQDSTAEIAKSFVQKDSRLTLLQQPNSGVAAARNLAIAKSKGEFIAPIDADDIWYPQNIEKQVKCMLASPESVGLVYAWSVDIDEQDVPTGGCRQSLEEGDVKLMLATKNFVGHASATLIRRGCFDQVGGYNTQFIKYNAQGCEDFDLYLRISEKYRFRVVRELLVGYRQVMGSMSCNSKSMRKSLQMVMLDFQRRNPEVPVTVYKSLWINYYMFLVGKSFSVGNYWDTIIWCYEGIKLQPKFSFNYKMLVRTVIKMISNPLYDFIFLKYEMLKKQTNIRQFNNLKKAPKP